MPLLPEAAIPARLDRGRILPAFLDERDQPWLHVLIDEVDRFRGRPLHELQQRLREPLPCATPHFKLRAAVQLLLRLGNAEIKSEVSPAEARETLFSEAATQAGKPRSAILAVAAATTRFGAGRTGTGAFRRSARRAHLLRLGKSRVPARNRPASQSTHCA